MLYSSKFRRCVNPKDSECNVVDNDKDTDININQVSGDTYDELDLRSTNEEGDVLPPARQTTCSITAIENCKRVCKLKLSQYETENNFKIFKRNFT